MGKGKELPATLASFKGQDNSSPHIENGKVTPWASPWTKDDDSAMGPIRRGAMAALQHVTSLRGGMIPACASRC
jgi:hypothetical protein